MSEPDRWRCIICDENKATHSEYHEDVTGCSEEVIVCDACCAQSDFGCPTADKQEEGDKR